MNKNRLSSKYRFPGAGYFGRDRAKTKPTGKLASRCNALHRKIRRSGSTEPTPSTLISGMATSPRIIVDACFVNTACKQCWPSASRLSRNGSQKAEAEGRYIKQTAVRSIGHAVIELHPMPSADHENMHELSTDDIDELAKKLPADIGQWKFDKETVPLFDKIVGGSIPREFMLH